MVRTGMVQPDWSEARDARRVAEKGRRARIFYMIIDNEYQEALRRPGEPGWAPAF
jgi:hypothetical protein